MPTVKEVKKQEIEPLLFNSISCENAFKYGVSTEKESEIKVNIDIIEQNLTLSIQNDKVTKFSSTIGTGIKTLLKSLIIHITTAIF